MIYHSLTELIGNTPLLELHRYQEKLGLNARLVAKLEMFNPCSSAKDRIALAMVEDGLASGKLTPDSVLIEPTSGNTGIGLAFVAATKGMRLILTMPETMSEERRAVLRALGAELVLTEGAKGMQGAVEKAEELARELPGGVILQQFENPSNPEAHRRTTAREILRDTGGELAAFVAGVGTGGTLTGVGEILRQEVPGIRIVAVEPAGSPLLSGGQAGPHKIQGIGANFIPKTLNTSVYDEVLAIPEEEAFQAVRELSRTEGLLCGISSGAALAAAVRLARREEFAGKRIVVLFPDTGERYLSTGLYD